MPFTLDTVSRRRSIRFPSLKSLGPRPVEGDISRIRNGYNAFSPTGLAPFQLRPALPGPLSAWFKGVGHRVAIESASFGSSAWERVVHPKGGPYYRRPLFRSGTTQIEIVTHLDPFDDPVVTLACDHLYNALRRSLATKLMVPSCIYAAIDYVNEDHEIGYHLADHVDRRVFWLENTQEPDFPRLKNSERGLEAAYWQHVICFPHVPMLSADALQSTEHSLAIRLLDATPDRSAALIRMEESLKRAWSSRGSHSASYPNFVNGTIQHHLCQTEMRDIRTGSRSPITTQGHDEGWIVKSIRIGCRLLLLAETSQSMVEDLSLSYCHETGQLLYADAWSKMMAAFQSQWNQSLPCAGVILATAGSLSTSTPADNDASYTPFYVVCAEIATILAFLAGLLCLILKYKFGALSKRKAAFAEKTIGEWDNTEFGILAIVTAFASPSICIKIAGALLLPAFGASPVLRMSWELSFLLQVVLLACTIGAAAFVPSCMRRLSRKRNPKERVAYTGSGMAV